MSDNAVVILPERPPAWMQRIETTPPDAPPTWLNQMGISPITVDYVPIQKSRWGPGLLLFIQLAGAAVLSVMLLVGIYGWVFLGRPSTLASLPSPPASRIPAVADVSATKESSLVHPQAQSAVPFPLPKTYGIYASSDGQLTELEALPVKIPDARIQLSAEIRKPSSVVVSGSGLAFVVFRRELVNSAPQKVSVRVVASVLRETKFIASKPTVMPVEGAWRIRSNAFEFKVSPVADSREMIIIRPQSEFTFPAGRYVLVLNGIGYDFTVAGPITAPEQCLEQTEALNGTVLSECRKS